MNQVKFPDEMDEDFEKLRRQWYKDENVLFNIIDHQKYRETVFIRKGVAHRCIKANAIKYLVANFSRYHFNEEPFNIYGSLAKFPDLPMFSFNRIQKKQQMNQFNVSFPKYMTTYDFLMDIDNEDLKLAYSTAFKVKRVLDSKKIPYYLIFSGKKGFHFRVDYEDFPQEMKVIKFPELAQKLKRFAENFRAINNLPDIDTSIFDLRRIAKTPYSVVYPYYLVAMPLTDEKFEDFKLSEMSLPYLIERTTELFKRGVLKRKGEPDNFSRLIKEYTEGLE